MKPLKAFTVSCGKDITIVITSIQVILQWNKASVLIPMISQKHFSEILYSNGEVVKYCASPATWFRPQQAAQSSDNTDFSSFTTDTQRRGEMHHTLSFVGRCGLFLHFLCGMLNQAPTVDFHLLSFTEKSY